MNKNVTKMILVAVALCALVYILVGQDVSALVDRPLMSVGLGLIGLGMIVESRKRMKKNDAGSPSPPRDDRDEFTSIPDFISHISGMRF
ncbi:MAG: hypothetical protein MJA84_01515 [Firmicutes bacterium]|nr:hypothetical protein [Bacillota bacterium]